MRDGDEKRINNRVRPAATVKATATVTSAATVTAAAAAAAAVGAAVGVVVVVGGEWEEEVVEVGVVGHSDTPRRGGEGGGGGSRGGGGGGCVCGRGEDILYHGAALWVWIDQRCHLDQSLRYREEEQEGKQEGGQEGEHKGNNTA